jgi:hypothetical protein
VDWNDPGVVAWLVEKGAYVPLEHVRMHLQDLQECQRLSMRPLDADIQGEEDEELIGVKKDLELRQRRLRE